MNRRAWNFSAGPAAMPLEVLQQAAEEMCHWHGSGMSVLEMSHRGPEFIGIFNQAQADLRELLDVPGHFKILFLQGGAIGANAFVPLNLGRGQTIDFVLSGSWSQKSLAEASRYGKTHVAASSEAQGFRCWPDPGGWKLSRHPSYVHLCSNETIHGVECHVLPDLKALGSDATLVLDFSSHLLSRPVDWSRVGLAYGGAQKNMGPAGLTLVVVREDLLGHALPSCPSAFDFSVVARHDSMYNTPPTYAIYLAGLTLQWIKRQGGVAKIEQRNIEKSRLLYDFLDRSVLYVNPVNHADRSRMNVPFFLRDESLNAAFLAGAQEHGLLQLKGHQSVGGMRASIYNAMPLAGVQALIDYLRDFEQKR